MAQKQKIGRPRAEERSGDGPVEEEILAAARHLFRRQGYSGTSTREIAGAAGLRQPTLFHYFKNKAAILDAIAQRAMQPEIEFIEAEQRLQHAPDVALYRYVHFVVMNLHTNPNVIGSPERFPELNHEDFAEFWAQYEHVQERMRDLIEEGIRQDLFVQMNAKVAGAQLFALMEYGLTYQIAEASPDDAARTAAVLVLRALLLRTERLPEVERDADV